VPNSRHYWNIDLLEWTFINVQGIKQFCKIGSHCWFDIGIQEAVNGKVTRVEIHQYLDTFVVSVEAH